MSPVAARTEILDATNTYVAKRSLLRAVNLWDWRHCSNAFTGQQVVTQMTVGLRNIFNLENYYFPSCSGGPILLNHSFTPSLHHSIIPSLPVRHLEIRGGGGSYQMKRQGILVGKLEFNSCGRLLWTLPELYYTPKRYCLKRNRFDY